MEEMRYVQAEEAQRKEEYGMQPEHLIVAVCILAGVLIGYGWGRTDRG